MLNPMAFRLAVIVKLPLLAGGHDRAAPLSPQSVASFQRAVGPPLLAGEGSEPATGDGNDDGRKQQGSQAKLQPAPRQQTREHEHDVQAPTLRILRRETVGQTQRYAVDV